MTNIWKPRLTDNGDIFFGRWHYENGKKLPIIWQIKEEIDGAYVLVSKKVIDYREFHHEKLGFTKYKDSDLRHWLNNEFFMEAFYDDERELIQETCVYIKTDNEYVDDHVYLLSEKYVSKYFKTQKDAVKYGRPYIFELTNEYGPKYEGKRCAVDYWLRNYYEWDSGDRSSFAYVNYEGVICHRDSKDIKRGVVPVIRIKKSDFVK